jgi:hypothetical protein
MTEAQRKKQDQFIVRLPDGMRDRIKSAADKNGRSMNAEIVATLEEAYPQTSLVERLMAHQQALFRSWEEEADPSKRAALAEEILALKRRIDEELELSAFAVYFDPKLNQK